MERISKFWRMLEHRSHLVRSNHQLFAAFHITLWCCVLANKCLETRKMWRSCVRFASLRIWRCVFRRVAPEVSKERGDFMVFALLGCYSAYVGSGLPTFWDNLLVTSSRVKQRKKKTACLTTQHCKSMTSVYCSRFSLPLVLKCCASCFGHRVAVCLKASHSVGKQACNII
jgi:hypothetical protein